jgi:hypothetical protein
MVYRLTTLPLTCDFKSCSIAACQLKFKLICMILVNPVFVLCTNSSLLFIDMKSYMLTYTHTHTHTHTIKLFLRRFVKGHKSTDVLRVHECVVTLYIYISIVC